MKALFLFVLFIALVRGFHVIGNQLYDPNNLPSLLRGFARPSLEWLVNGENLSLQDYQLMKSWGANVVRLSLNQCFWLPGSKGYDSTYKSIVDTQVNNIRSLNMSVILDLHWSDKGSSSNDCGQQIMADSNSITFWQDVANTYKSNPWVLFELYNEPHDVSWSAWLSGGDTGNGFNTPGMQAIYDAIRNTGANNTVVIGGLNYAYDLSQVSIYTVSGHNIMYNTHPYDFGGKLPGDWDKSFGYLTDNYPIIATEFGDLTCDSNYYYEKFIAYTDYKKIHWTSWAWYPGGCGFPGLITDWTGTPSESGLVVKASLSGQTIIVPPPHNYQYQIYSDAVNAPWADYSWATHNSQDNTVVHSGNYSFSLNPSSNTAAYFFCSGCISPISHTGIEFWINAGSGGDQRINLCMIVYNSSQANKVGPDQDIRNYLEGGQLVANTWIRGFVNLTEFPSVTYDGIFFITQTGDVQPTVYLDDITAYSRNETVSTTTTGDTTNGGASNGATTAGEESVAEKKIVSVISLLFVLFQ